MMRLLIIGAGEKLLGAAGASHSKGSRWHFPSYWYLVGTLHP